MSARHEVDKLLGQWFRLTQAEAGAIQSAAWTNVTDIQSAKSVLQKSLAAALEQWTSENGHRILPVEHPFRTEVSQLVSLEARNAELLSAQVRRAETERHLQTESIQNLRRLRRSYGQKTDKGWESYS